MARAVLLLRHAYHRVSMVFMKHNNYIQLFLHGIDHHLTSVLFSSGFAKKFEEVRVRVVERAAHAREPRARRTSNFTSLRLEQN